MTVVPASASYDLPTDIDTTSPLTDPPHSTLHNETGRAVQDLNNRVNALSQVLTGLTAPNGTIDQARQVANTWYVTGSLEANRQILMPLIWNITGRPSTYQSAKASVLNAADGDIEIDLVIGSVLSGPIFDENTQSSILTAGKLVIPSGEFISVTLGPGDFVGEQPVDTYVAAYIEAVGSFTTSGADLTIQLNRNL